MGGACGDGSSGGIMTVAVSTASKSTADMPCAKRALELRSKSSLRMGGCYIKEHDTRGNLSLFIKLRWGLVNVHSSTWFRVISV